jgi:Secretory lipase
MPRLVRRVAMVVVVVLVAATAAVLAPSAVPTAGAQAPGFYTPPAPLPAGRDGDVIKSERISRNNASGSRIMYLSRDREGQRMAVTGTVLVPNAAWTGPGPRPIVAYAPFTAGLGDQCAVSRLLGGGGGGDLVSGVQTAFVNALLTKGFAVAQTDYEGLGTPGDHTYVVRLSQSHAVLDVLRAAQRLPGTGLPASGPVGIAGYSQGGGASASAAELAPTYAPELDLRGAYIGAPVSDLGTLADKLDGGFYAAFLLYALVGMDAAYEEVDLQALANDQGKQIIARAKETCTFNAVLSFGYRQSRNLTVTGQPVRDYLPMEPFASIIAENRVGNLEPEAPVVIEHSPLDDVLPAAQAQTLRQSWCAMGANVQYNNLNVVVPVFVHLLSANAAANRSASWLQQRFNGQAQAGNCPA